MAYFHTTVLDNQIKALPTIDTASGSVATFDTDMTENLVEVKCQIVAQQGGSGTPSPSNPRPITTYSEMNLAHIGNNAYMSIFEGLMNGTWGCYEMTGAEGWTLQQPSQNKYYSNNYYLRDLAIRPSDNNHSVPILTTLGFFDIAYNNLQSYENSMCIAADGRIGITPDLYTGSGTLQGELIIYEKETPSSGASITPTQWNKLLTALDIDGSLHNIPFGQTVANGVLDVTTGKLRVTHGVVDLGDLSWTRYNASGNYVFYADILDGRQYATAGIDVNSLCSCFSVYPTTLGATAVGSGNDKMLGINHSTQYTYTRILVKDDDYTSASTFTTAMSGQYLTYELATPIEIQLDSTQITALLNENNIWCDTGDTSVKYILSVGKAIS